MHLRWTKPVAAKVVPSRAACAAQLVLVLFIAPLAARADAGGPGGGGGGGSSAPICTSTIDKTAIGNADSDLLSALVKVLDGRIRSCRSALDKLKPFLKDDALRCDIPTLLTKEPAEAQDAASKKRWLTVTATLMDGLCAPVFVDAQSKVTSPAVLYAAKKPTSIHRQSRCVAPLSHRATSAKQCL